MTARRGAVLVLALLAILTGIEVAAARPAHRQTLRPSHGC